MILYWRTFIRLRVPLLKSGIWANNALLFHIQNSCLTPECPSTAGMKCGLRVGALTRGWCIWIGCEEVSSAFCSAGDKCIFFYSNSIFSLPCRKHNGQQPSEHNLLRSRDSCVTSVQVRKNKKKTTSPRALQFLRFHVVGPNTAGKGDSFFKSFSHFFCFKAVFSFASRRPHTWRSAASRVWALALYRNKEKEAYNNSHEMSQPFFMHEGLASGTLRRCFQPETSLSLWTGLKKKNPLRCTFMTVFIVNGLWNWRVQGLFGSGMLCIWAGVTHILSARPRPWQWQEVCGPRLRVSFLSPSNQPARMSARHLWPARRRRQAKSSPCTQTRAI